MTFNLYGDITDQSRKQKTFLKTQHNIYDYHTPYNQFTKPNSTFEPTNIKVKKRFNFNQGAHEEQVDYLHNKYKKEPTIAYFQSKIPPYIANREMRGGTVNYNVMVHRLGWN